MLMDRSWFGWDGEGRKYWGNKEEHIPCPNGYEVPELGILLDKARAGIAVEDGLQEPQVVKHGNVNLLFGGIDLRGNGETVTRYDETPSTHLPSPGGTAGLWGKLTDQVSPWFKEIAYVDWGNTLDGRVLLFYLGWSEDAEYNPMSMPIRCIKKE